MDLRSLDININDVLEVNILYISINTDYHSNIICGGTEALNIFFSGF